MNLRINITFSQYALTRVLFGLLGLGWLAGCEISPATVVTAITPTVPSIEVNITPTPTATAEIVPTVTPETITLNVWMPDRLYPVNDAEALEVFAAQVDEFINTRSNVLVDVRRKRYQDVGGVISTLRTASAVAPGALPDLTLVRRRELLIAQQSGLIQPFEGRISSVVVADLYDSALKLGQVNNQLYGLTYTFDLVVMASHSRTPLADWRFETILNTDLSFAFAVQNTSGLSETFLLQYLAVGGKFSAEGDLTLDETALRETLSFYEQALALGLTDTRILNYTFPTDYESLLIDGEWDAGIINTDDLYGLYGAGYTPQITPLPTLNGNLITMADGWIWVLVTKDNDRQTIAGDFVNWMMNTQRQGLYAQAINIIPSQSESLHAYPFADLTAETLEPLIDSAILPIGETNTGVVVRAIQAALISVINGEATAEEATRNAVDQLSG